MSDIRVLALVGSLRAESVNRKILDAVLADAPAGVAIEIAEGLEHLPFYNEDIDTDDVAPAVRKFRQEVAEADRILFVLPEYNGTMPAVLNNAIDWASRPFGEGAIKGKAVAVVGAAGGQYGGTWAHQDTRRSAKVAGANVIEDIELSHAFAWGTDPAEDAEVVAQFAAAVAKLAAYEGIA
ncbi:NADPH-dependent FMN reductase [Nocardioides insulae]|uniref:NADPH-dependent FMN reductase n=1 Tax=Nocardioides insulae TaxID=394734 RepID=UPI0004019BD6|nr:NADPH-dependent FMN reductase [Nocardioides insulae]